MKSTTEKAILIIAAIGMLLAAYAISLHFTPPGAQFCNISTTVNCDKVNNSPWSSFLGVPVAVGGIIAYLALFMIVLKRKAITRMLDFSDKDFWMYVYIIVILMLSFQLYLTLAELFLVQAYCIICLSSQLCIILLAVLTAKEALKQ